MSRRRRRGRGFTLVEIVLAVTIGAMLMAAVLALLAGVGRDHQRMAAGGSTGRADAAVRLLRWDMTNAHTITSAADGIVMRGHGGLDPVSLKPNNRLALVSYRVRRDGRVTHLVREQRYLDDLVRPQPWSDVVMSGVDAVAVAPAGDEKPSRVTLRLLLQEGSVTEQLWVK